MTGPMISRGDAALLPLASEHLEQVRLWRNSPAVGQFMYTETQLTPNDQKLWFERLLPDPTRGAWLIVLDGLPVGLVSLTEYSAQHARASAGYYIADECLRGIGLGPVIEWLVLELFFGHYKGYRLEREVFASNIAALDLLERFGFRREGLLRAHAIKNNARIDVIRLALLAQEWHQLRPYFDSILPR